jgi:hypothetical protein
MVEQGNCYRHPGVEAIQGCARCQQLICGECCTQHHGQTYCLPCGEEVVTMALDKAVSQEDFQNIDDPYSESILKRRIDSPWIITAIIVITVIIVAVEIYVMTR